MLRQLLLLLLLLLLCFSTEKLRLRRLSWLRFDPWFVHLTGTSHNAFGVVWATVGVRGGWI
jgi:hypothetical protein